MRFYNEIKKNLRDKKPPTLTMYSRLSILLCGGGILSYWIPFLLEHFLKKDFSNAKLGIFAVIGTILIEVALAVKFILMKCPHCHKRGLNPRWRAGYQTYCPYCGSRIEEDPWITTDYNSRKEDLP